MAITERTAAKSGFRLVRGAYAGTTDNRIDRWYIDDETSSVIDRRGPGFRTKREALERVTERLEDRDE